MLQWIVDDTRALIADLQAFSRRMSTKLQWLKLRSKHRVETAAAELENVRRSAGTRTRMCSSCRALIPVDAKHCPECGEAPGRRVPTGVSRVLESMVPGVMSVTSMLLTMNMAVYALSCFVEAQVAAGLASEWRDAAWGITLKALGAMLSPEVFQGESWRLLTYLFLHGSLLHLLMNSWALLTVGPLMEELYGRSRFFLIYLVTGVSGGLISALRSLHAGGFSVGASGAIFGLIGMAAVWGWRRGGSVGQTIKGQMVQWALYGLAMGFFIRGIDNFAHLGGLACGALLGLLIPDTGTARAASSRLWDSLAFVAALALAAAFVMVALRFQETMRLLTAL